MDRAMLPANVCFSFVGTSNSRALFRSQCAETRLRRLHFRRSLNISSRTILPATLERAACQPLLNAALEDAAVNRPLLFFFLRELIWYYGDIVS